MKSGLDRVRGHTFVPSLLPPSPVVLDLGANHGLFSEAMVTRFGAKCWSVEPNPTLVDEVAGRGAVAVINRAIDEAAQPIRLRVAANDEASTIHAAATDEPVATYVVESISLRSLLDELGLSRIHLLKLDIEGMETDALTGLRDDQLARIDQCCVEFHDSQRFTTSNDIAAVNSTMARAGFRRLKMSVRDYSDVLYVRRDAMSGPTWFLSSNVVAPYRMVRRFLHRRFGHGE